MHVKFFSVYATFPLQALFKQDLLLLLAKISSMFSSESQFQTFLGEQGL
jgi:hypothetical protein